MEDGGIRRWLRVDERAVRRVPSDFNVQRLIVRQRLL